MDVTGLLLGEDARVTVAGEVGVMGVAEVSPPDSARGHVVADRGGEAVDDMSYGGGAPAGTTIDAVTVVVIGESGAVGEDAGDRDA